MPRRARPILRATTGSRTTCPRCSTVPLPWLSLIHIFVLVRQYRTAIDRVTVEIPAGKLDPGEDPLDCAKRELHEETGFKMCIRDRSKLEVIVDEIEFMSSRGGQGGYDQGGYAPAAPAPAARPAAPVATPPAVDVYDEDIPF